MIVKLVLQPIVENAIYHGIKYKGSKGTLRIRAYAAGEDVCIAVEDDGIGMDETVLRNIFDRERKRTSKTDRSVCNTKNR